MPHRCATEGAAAGRVAAGAGGSDTRHDTPGVQKAAVYHQSITTVSRLLSAGESTNVPADCGENEERGETAIDHHQPLLAIMIRRPATTKHDQTTSHDQT